MALVNLVRHAQASFGADDYDRLSELGLRQARLLGDWLRARGEQPTRVIAGPLKRHRQTAEACLDAAGFDAPIEVVDGLRELDHVEILARHEPRFADAAAMRASLATQADPARAFQAVFVAAMQRWIGGAHTDYTESWVQFRQRSGDALAHLLRLAGRGDSLWAFTSGGPIAAILQHVLDVPDARVLDLTGTLVNCGVTRLRRHGDRARLEQYNACAHLERHADPSLVTYR
ncbi:MAG: histidine phosphatase family protein [Xanthomonadales bacterium]|nr:histidine phosphatase family protein [Xanthomonadales bacterium]